jgi:RNA polymerase sigma factor (sigma-70 family)
MANVHVQTLSEHLGTLFGSGTCAGLSDGELLDRFLSHRDEAGERAFEALMTRHGPMVLQVCRNLLDDPTEVHDAFQAVFLVLARRAGAIRKSGSVGSWLYGVAVRLAARVRVSASRRRVRDRRTIEAAGILAAVGTQSPEILTTPIERSEGSAAVHQEVDRLPEKYRAPIVLCYLEGMTHDEAAARLSWPVGTVRSRLARARAALRTRLTRRGVTATGALGPIAAWLSGDLAASPAAAASASSPPLSLPGQLTTSLARTVSRVAAGESAAAGSLSATSLILAQGVLKTMMLKKLAFAACVLLSVGTMTIGGGAVLVRTSRAQGPRPAPAAAPGQATKPAPAPDTTKADELDPLLKQLLEAARKRLDAQKAYYEEGRITIDRFLDACARLERVELMAAKTDAERLTIGQRFVDLLKEIEVREQAELQVGRGTVADLAEALERRLEAEYELKARRKEAGEAAAILRRLSDLERKVDHLLEQDRPKASQRGLDSPKDQTLFENLDQLRRVGRKLEDAEKSQGKPAVPRP